MIYEVHRLTDSMLMDGEDRSMGRESAGVVSRHRTLAAAERACARMNSNRMSARHEIRRRNKDEAGCTAEPIGEV